MARPEPRPAPRTGRRTPADRMAAELGPLGPGRRSAVDLLDPVPTAEPADTLGRLLDGSGRKGKLTAGERDKLLSLSRILAERARHKEAYEALGRDADRLNAELQEIAVNRGCLDPKTGKIAFEPVEDEHGIEHRPFERRDVWPKYRENDETQQRYAMADLVAALIEAGLSDLVIHTTASQQNPSPEGAHWPGYVRDRLKRWRKVRGEDGKVNAEGRFVDLDDVPLDEAEAADPTDDLLALPRPLRRVAEPEETIKILFTRRRVESKAAAELDAAVDAAVDAARAATAAADGPVASPPGDGADPQASAPSGAEEAPGS